MYVLAPRVWVRVGVGAAACNPRTTREITPHVLSLSSPSRRGVKSASSRHDGAHRVIGSERRLALWITMHFKYDSPILTAAELIISLPAPCDPPPARWNSQSHHRRGGNLADQKISFSLSERSRKIGCLYFNQLAPDNMIFNLALYFP